MADVSAEFIRLKKRKCSAALLISKVLDESNDNKRCRGKTRAWIRRRSEKGHFNNIARELMIEDTARYKELIRMNYDNFCEILRSIEQYITPKEIFGGAKLVKAAERLTQSVDLFLHLTTFCLFFAQ